MSVHIMCNDGIHAVLAFQDSGSIEFFIFLFLSGLVNMLYP